MNNFIKTGKRVTVPAPSGGVTSGDFVIVGSIYGVAAYTALVGDPVEIERVGIFTLPKATGAAWSLGDQLYWDSSAKKFTKTVGTNQRIGVAAADAASGDATGSVLLHDTMPASVTQAIQGVAAGYKIARGQLTTASAADTVATGLTTVVSAVASWETDPADANTFLSCQVGDQAGAPVAGSIIIKSWKTADGADVTPAAASAFSKKVNWIAIGT